MWVNSSNLYAEHTDHLFFIVVNVQRRTDLGLEMAKNGKIVGERGTHEKQ
jgi:hypothetical protein